MVHWIGWVQIPLSEAGLIPYVGLHEVGGRGLGRASHAHAELVQVDLQGIDEGGGLPVEELGVDAEHVERAEDGETLFWFLHLGHEPDITLSKRPIEEARVQFIKMGHDQN